MQLSDSDELKSSSEEEDSDFDSDNIESEERKRKQTAKKVCTYIVYIFQTLFLIFSPFIYSFTLKHCVFGARNHGRGCPGVKRMFLELGKHNFFDFWSCSTLPYKQNELNFLKVFARFSAFLKN